MIIKWDIAYLFLSGFIHFSQSLRGPDVVKCVQMYAQSLISVGQKEVENTKEDIF